MKKLLVLAALTALVFANTALATFTDVNETTPYQTAISWMSDNGVINGYGDGTFQPDTCVNRVEMLKMLFLMNGTELYSEEGTAGSNYYDSYFTDTDTSQWYWSYLDTALRNGTVEGYSDRTFKPTRCVNRAEALKMTVLEFNNGSIPETEGYSGISLLYSSFVDIDYSEWYGDYYKFALPREILGLDHIVTIENPDSDWGTDKHYYPAEDMSRAEVAELLYRQKAIQDTNSQKFNDTLVPSILVASEEILSNPTATIVTNLGTMTFELYQDQAPITANNFINLAKDDLYNGSTFHRVIQEFMIQGGDFENNDGTGGYAATGPGTTIDDEFAPSLTHQYGALSMANAGPNTAGSQFFIVNTQAGTPFLDGRHAIFGQLLSGSSVLDTISAVETGFQDKPIEEVTIVSITIQE